MTVQDLTSESEASEEPKQIERRKRQAGGRGVTLIEIMVVLAIVGLIAGGIAFVAIPQLNKAKLSQARNDGLAIRTAAQSWRSDHGGEECPTVEKLKADNVIDKAIKGRDPWDQPYKIECEGEDVTVTSLGPDKKEGTDDIKVPDTQAAEGK